MCKDMPCQDQSRVYCLPSVALDSCFVVFTEMGATGWRDQLRRRVGGQ